jgi:putative addiction module component (TIGR02574 family)
VTDLEKLTQKVLELPLEDRARIADKLLESMDRLTPEEIQAIWAEEAERRYQAYKSGLIAAFPGDEVHREILDDLK